LIELSLGKTISAMSRPEDEAMDLSQHRFNTALRVLANVYNKSGSMYGDVVKTCLDWPRSRGQCFEDSEFEEYVFDIAITPLLKDLDHFEGFVHVK
jgi:hypothetical protein